MKCLFIHLENIEDDLLLILFIPVGKFFKNKSKICCLWAIPRIYVLEFILIFRCNLFLSISVFLSLSLSLFSLWPEKLFKRGFVCNKVIWFCRLILRCLASIFQFGFILFFLMFLELKFDYGFEKDEQKSFDVIHTKCAYRQTK